LFAGGAVSQSFIKAAGFRVVETDGEAQDPSPRDRPLSREKELGSVAAAAVWRQDVEVPQFDRIRPHEFDQTDRESTREPDERGPGGCLARRQERSYDAPPRGGRIGEQ
jgi:hypothetical protein